MVLLKKSTVFSWNLQQKLKQAATYTFGGAAIAISFQEPLVPKTLPNGSVMNILVVGAGAVSSACLDLPSAGIIGVHYASGSDALDRTQGFVHAS